jgi:hypothetical protein
MGYSTGLAFPRLSFTNANYFYGTQYAVSNLGIDPYNASSRPFKMASTGGILYVTSVHHRGAPSEWDFDMAFSDGAQFNTVFVRGCYGAKFTNCNTVSGGCQFYISDCPLGVTIAGGDVRHDSSSVVSGTPSLITLLDDSLRVNFSPVTPANWASSTPTNIKNAIDRLTALVVTLNGGSPIP